MIKQCISLVRIELMRMMNWNEIRYGKDPKKRNRAVMMLILYCLVGAVLMLYVGGLAYVLQLAGAAKQIPAYLFALTSVVTLVFTFLKAGSALFGAKDYEMLISLPVKPVLIVVKGFMTMYIGNLVFTILTMLPGVIVYFLAGEGSAVFLVLSVISIFFIPLIPMTIATAAGTLITAVASRMKHKSLITVVLSFGLCLGVMWLSFGFGMSAGSGQMDMKQLSDLSAMITGQINNIYPLASFYTAAVTEGQAVSFLLFVLLSSGIFLVFAVLAAWKYAAIHIALASHATGKKYVLKELKTASPLIALYRKEWKRFLGCPIYVMNGGVGYILMLAASVGLLVMGADKLETLLGVPGLLNQLAPAAAIIICLFTVICPTTVASVSLEGKQLWLPLSLPISAKTWFDSKILLNLTLSIPTCLICSVLFAIALPFEFPDLVLLFVTPLVYSLFIAVLGLTLNLKLPNFTWENEVTAVKQSSALMLCMLAGFVSCSIPFAGIVLLKTVPAWVVLTAADVIVAFLGVLLYMDNNKTDLKKLAEQ